MTTAYSSLLGLALPVQGELSGTWGDMVDNGITQYLDIAVAGTQSITGDSNVTLSLTNGTSSATNLAQVGSGTTGSAQYAIISCTGARTALRTITVPAQSKIYTVINATTGGFSIKVVGAGPTTGVTIIPGESAQIAWNGSDFVKNAITSTLQHPLLDVEYEGATGALIHIEAGQKLTLGEAIQIGEGVSSGFSEDSSVKMGARISTAFMEGVRVTAIVTGVKSPNLFGQGSVSGAAQQMVAASSATVPDNMIDQFM